MLLYLLSFKKHIANGRTGNEVKVDRRFAPLDRTKISQKYSARIDSASLSLNALQKYSRYERPPRPSVSRSLWRLRIIRVPTKIRSNVEKQSSDRNRGSTSLGVVARACQSFRYRQPRAFRTCSARNAHAPRYATYRRTVLNWRDVELS